MHVKQRQCTHTRAQIYTSISITTTMFNVCFENLNWFDGMNNENKRRRKKPNRWTLNNNPIRSIQTQLASTYFLVWMGVCVTHSLWCNIHTKCTKSHIHFVTISIPKGSDFYWWFMHALYPNTWHDFFLLSLLLFCTIWKRALCAHYRVNHT